MTTDPWHTAAPRPYTARQPERAAQDFDALFLAHYAEIYRLLYRIVGAREEAEDLAQEAFLRLHRSPHLWASGEQHEHNVRAWLFRVATNLAYNALRHERRSQARQERLADNAAGNGAAPDPIEAALQMDARTTVRQALAALPARQGQLLVLRYAGLSYRELAVAVAVAPGSVGTLLARAETAFERAYRALVPAQGGEHEV